MAVIWFNNATKPEFIVYTGILWKCRHCYMIFSDRWRKPDDSYRPSGADCQRRQLQVAGEVRDLDSSVIERAENWIASSHG